MTLLASTVIWVQNQLNVLSIAAERLCLAVNLDKSIVIVFRKYGLRAAKKNGSRFGDAVLEVVINYKCLGLTYHRTYLHCDNGGDVNKSKEKHSRNIKSAGCGCRWSLDAGRRKIISPSLEWVYRR